jgi:hypothetical protein
LEGDDGGSWLFHATAHWVAGPDPLRIASLSRLIELAARPLQQIEHLGVFVAIAGAGDPE